MTTASTEMTPRAKQEGEPRERPRPGRYFVPEVDIAEDQEGLYLWADMPGVAADQVTVHLADDTFHLEGRVAVDDWAGLRPLYTEYNVGDYVRRFTLADASRYDRDAITARLVDGVLQVRLPRSERAKPRTITVSG